LIGGLAPQNQKKNKINLSGDEVTSPICIIPHSRAWHQAGSQLGVVTEKLGVVRKLNVVRTALTTLNF
jgi:hypothetical protein